MSKRSRIIATGFSIVFLLAIAGTTIARESSTQAEATLKSGDTYFDVSQYREALKRYQDAVVLASRKQDWLTEAKALTQLTRVEIYLGDNDLAQQHISRAIDLLTRDQRHLTPAGRNAYGEALTSQGELAHARGRFKTALTNFDEALKSLDGDRNGQARAHLFIGYIKGSTGNIDSALAEINQALKLYQATNNKAGEGQAFSALGLVYLQNGDSSHSIEQNESALKIFRAIGDRHSEAIANNALGQAYESVKQYSLALKQYQQALRLFEEAGAVNGIAPTNCLVAGMYSRNNDPDQALKYYKRCLNLSHAAGMVRTEVKALMDIADVYMSQRRYDLALAQHKRVQKFFKRIEDRRGQGIALNLYGDLLFQMAKYQRAADIYKQALSLNDQIGDVSAQISTLYQLARTNLALGAPEVALQFIQQSLKLIEDQRTNVASPEFRTSYFSGVRRHYDLYMDILWQLKQLHPENDFAAQAFTVSEKSRARLLLDLVSESGANIRTGASKELLDKEQELRGLIRLQAQHKMDLTGTSRDPAELIEVQKQLGELEVQYQQVEAQLRQQNPYLSSLEHLAPLNVEQIQKELRESNSMLLEFFVGEERSYLLAVTSDGIEMHELPGRETIEDAARRSYASITAIQPSEGVTADEYQAKIAAADKEFDEVSKLSQMLFGPVAGKLGTKRLIIIVEGALQYVPFAALPAPNGSGARLLTTNEIVLEPSFSTLSAIRNNLPQHTNSPNKLVAVIADPVLSRTDYRVQSQLLSPGTTLAATDNTDASEIVTHDARLTRLAHASEEADAIYSVAPWFTTMVAKGFDASRETAMSPNVGQYQIVHFATHGLVDTEQPELSSIVLTMFDRNGASTDGLMSLHDIYSLNLSAELTVLSACQTAIGKDIKGEGMVGLSHAFMSAGSKSVVSSLWKVDDRATAVLMSYFYEAMLKQGMSPAAALRFAQLRMMQDKRTSAPYYWAGFVLQGEYTNRIKVDDGSSLRIALALLLMLSLFTAGVLVFRRRRFGNLTREF